MEEKRVIDRLRNGEKIQCGICKEKCYDVDIPNRNLSNYFHCENPECKGYVHEQKNINVE